MHLLHNLRLLRVQPKTAGLVSTYNYSGSGNIDYPLAAAITLAACASAQWGARTTMTVDQNLLKKVLGAFMCVAAPLVPLKSWMFRNRVPVTGADHVPSAEASGGEATLSLIDTFLGGTMDPTTLSLVGGVGYGYNNE